MANGVRLSQERLTRDLKTFLESGEDGWRVLSVHYPGAQAGLRIHRRDEASGRSLGHVVPDLIATKGNVLLFVESDVEFSESDVEKLIDLTINPSYRRDIERLCDLPISTMHLLRAIAIPHQFAEGIHLPPDFLVFSWDEVGYEVFGTMADAAGSDHFPAYSYLDSLHRVSDDMKPAAGSE